MCATTGCTGARLGVGGWCLVHTPAEDLAGLLPPSEHGVDIDGRGTHLTRTSMARILELVPAGGDGRRRLGTVRFDGATLDDAVSFDDTTFAGEASFAGATFCSDARFGGAVFTGPVDCRGTSFGGQAWFVGAAFGGAVSFGSARFAGPAWFQHARFAGPALFDGATFAANVTIADATFADGSSFEGATFEGHMRLDRATCAAGWRFDDARFAHEEEGPAHRVRPPAGTVVGPVVVRDAALGSPAPARPPRQPRQPRPPRSSRRSPPRPARASPVREEVRNPRWTVLLAVVVLAAGAYIVFRPTGTTTPPEATLGTARTAFLHQGPAGAATRHDTCLPLRIVVNEAGAPPGWRAGFEEALTALRTATGMPAPKVEATNEPVEPNLRAHLREASSWPADAEGFSRAYQELFRRPSYQPVRWGPGVWAPVLMGWVSFGSATAGYRHSPDGVAASDPRRSEGKVVYVSGTIALNTDVPPVNLKATFMHHVGHVLGLGHVGPTDEVMHPTERTRQQWGQGDLVGLKAVAPPGQCLEAPAPGA